ncbi:MBL fold metallo-hydrolase [Nonomuraea sp. SYSU D8015]|uniref:MBL fold metallo-hydrolase n=1 Tax=Nonomuraea sp. SYSU D8015 TaxID=2593644 RepID=UPI001660C918|nr:MBL fold metallo-hydrolase [Nonomuraea sp. SYSU D8015]
MHHDGPADKLEKLAVRLSAASEEELLAILAQADADDEEMHTNPPQLGSAHPVAAGATEVTLLGALGHRYGMLAGGAGGLLVRTRQTCVLVDPGPAALGLLVRLTRQGRFDFGEVDAVLVSHFHPDHYTDVIPCLEGAVSARGRRGRVMLAANTTVIRRFGAFSPFHMRRVDPVALAHPDGAGEGEPMVKLADLTIYATPALHHEQDDEIRTAIGFAFDTPGGGIWYTGDTNLFGGLIDAVAALPPETDLVIAHVGGTNFQASPERAAVCRWHLQTRDIQAIAAALRPAGVIVQHYDAAYATARYRVAQALWLQRHLRAGGGKPTLVIPGRNGLHVTLHDQQPLRRAVVLDDLPWPYPDL